MDGKHKESIILSYQHVYRLLMHLKNIIHVFQQIKNPDDITKEVYRDSIVKKYEF